ncbi:RNA polymerase sigma-70 factor [Niabella ginsengisoli]|uniref:RNA polymerase sigma-70 factor n=1 Tax=Niabella ginsengisoli TaxID=522298 RepID=A0ABS9SDM8_9BACT|nr:RNA polymerase sigma-70 factor [Niabella ginsengisoli]
MYARYRLVLKEMAEKMLDSKQIAEDIVQELFLNLYNRRYQIDIQVSLRSYLKKAIKFRILNEYRSSGVRNTYRREVNAQYTLASSENNCYDFEIKDLNYSIQTTIDGLPDKCKTAFLLSRTEDLSYKDISGYMGISVSTVEKHISKALKVLKSNLIISDFSIN